MQRDHHRPRNRLLVVDRTRTIEDSHVLCSNTTEKEKLKRTDTRIKQRVAEML